MPSDYIDLGGVAEIAGVKRHSAMIYHQRATRNRRAGIVKPGDLPEPDLIVGGRPAWKRATIIAWNASRPGRGFGGGQPAHRKPE